MGVKVSELECFKLSLADLDWRTFPKLDQISTAIG